MSLYLDVTYLQLLSSQLRNFKKVRDNLYTCSCPDSFPFCGDSKKDRTKSRGYFFKTDDSLIYKCHNCGISLSLKNFLKEKDPQLHTEYIFHKYNHGNDTKLFAEKKEVFAPRILKVKDIGLSTISNLPDDHYAKQYIISRQLPEEALHRIYFTDNWSVWAKEKISEKYTEPSDHRIVLPFFDATGNLVGAQGRSLSSNKKMRYVTAKADHVDGIVFGLDKWDKFKLTYVVEGPIDSLFIPNGLAVATSDLVSVFRRIPELNPKETVLVYDNEPSSKEITSLMRGAIDDGFNVCIWPKKVFEKDINDMILKGSTIKEIQDTIDGGTLNGLLATLELSDWKKI